MNTSIAMLLRSVVAAAAAVVLAQAAAARPAAEALYKTKCAVCHGADGKGETAIGKANKMQDLSSAEVRKRSDEDLAEVISKGKGKMPAYAKSLKPDEIKGLVAYIRAMAKK